MKKSTRLTLLLLLLAIGTFGCNGVEPDGKGATDKSQSSTLETGIDAPQLQVYKIGSAALVCRWQPYGSNYYEQLYAAKDPWTGTDDTLAFGLTSGWGNWNYQWDVYYLNGYYLFKCNWSGFKNGTSNYSYYLCSGSVSPWGNMSGGIARVSKADEAYWLANNYFPSELCFSKIPSGGNLLPEPCYYLANAETGGFINIEHLFSMGAHANMVTDDAYAYPMITGWSNVESTRNASSYGWWSAQWAIIWSD